MGTVFLLLEHGNERGEDSIHTGELKEKEKRKQDQKKLRHSRIPGVF